MGAFQQQILGSMIGFLLAELIVYGIEKFASRRKR